MKDIILIEASSKSTYQRKYKCPYCEQKFERTKLHIHIQNKHEELIPEGYTALRVAFNTINNKTEGHCIMCGKVSDWNEDKGRYERLCNDPKCHEAYKRMAAERNKKKYGTERLQSDPRYAEEVQRKALQGRRIAGKYKFTDGGEIDYLGAYERRLLEFMDKVMKCKSEDIAAPGPTIKYMYQDKEHLYISDFYYIPYNLIIEVKDGGDNPNTNPALRGYKTERQEAKEAAVKATGKYNYVRQTNNDFSQIMSIMAVLKYNLQNEYYDPIMRINESMLLEEQYNQKITIYEIKSIASKIAQKTKSDEKPPTGNQNCMLCTWCTEAQIRGINILPRPIYSPRDIAFKQKGYNIIKNPSKTLINNLDHVKSILLRHNNSRYYVHVNWKNSTSGHEFIITNIDNKIYVIDSQAGLVESIDSQAGKYYFKDINYSNSYIVRMDNKEINNDILKYNDIKYLIEWDEEKDIAYMESDEYKNLNEAFLLKSKLSLSKFLRDNSIDDAYELYDWMHKNIKYKSTGKYQSPEETIKRLSGDCHDQSELAYQCLIRLGYQVGKVFMVEYYDYEKPGGRTHTLTYFLSNNNYYWFENAWENKAGIHKLKGKQFIEILKPVFEAWDWSGKCDKLYWTPFRANPKYGCDLGEYVGLLTPEKEPKKNIYYKDKSLNESILFNEKDIYYNKDKFDSGEINLCFVTGHSGSGKSTMARDMQKNNVEHYELDDLQCIKDHFTMSQLKEYGDLIYSYFNGPGKKFYMTYQELVDNKIPGSEYEDKLFPGFVHYAMQYAKSHKDRKYVIEGVWLFCNDDNGSPWFKPEEFKDYAFYIKGTSMIVSKWRAAKRDAEDNDNSFDRLRYSSKDFFFNNWKWYFIDEKQINRFRNYFKKISINESSLYESDDASKLDKNFKSKSGIEFDIVDIRDKKVKGNIDEIKGKYKDYFKGFAAFEKETDNFAGFIRIWPDWVLEEKYHGNLISPVEVKSKYRGYGLGKLLVKKAIEKYDANMLMVAKDNEVAINMYKKLGFSISQNTKWKNEDYYIMTTNTVKLLKSTNKITEDMSGTIGAALAPTTKGANIIKPLPVPTPYESDPDHYLVINTRPDQKLSYSITRDPLQYTLYSVDPQEKGFYKVFKSDKGKISKNYLTFKIKDKKKAKELYENLIELYKRNLTFMDHGLSSDVNENYIYSYLTDGNNIITPDQILFDNRFELVRSFEESVNYESSKIYNYLLNGYSIEDELNILSEQVKELEEDINE